MQQVKPKPPEEQTDIIFQDAFDFDIAPIDFGDAPSEKGQLELGF